MRFWNFIITANFILLATLASGQTVNLSRMQRALGQGRIIYTDSLGQQQYRILSNILDTMVTGGNFGSGTDGYYPVFSADTLRDGKIWNAGSDTIKLKSGTSDAFFFTPTIFSRFKGGYPLLKDGNYVFYDDEDLGILRLSANTMWLIAGSALQPVARFNGSTIIFDANRDNTNEMEISINNTAIAGLQITAHNTANTTHIVGLTSGNNTTKMALGSGLSVSFGSSIDTLKASSSAMIDTFTLTSDTIRLSLTGDGEAAKLVGLTPYRQTIDTITFTSDTLRISLSGDNQPAKIVSMAPSFAQLYSYSAEAITATSITKFVPVSGWAPLEKGDLDAQEGSNQINPNAAMTARVNFTANVNMDGGSFNGYVNFYIYKNGSFSAPLGYSVGKFDTDEYKMVNVQGLVELAANDEIDVRYSLTTALGVGTMYITNAVLNVTKL